MSIQLKSLYEQCIHELSSLSTLDINFSEKHIKYGFLLLQTRSWASHMSNYNIINTNHTNKNIYLVPGMDLLQHRNFKSCLGEFKNENNENNYTMITGDNYIKGNEIYDNYGVKDNLELLAQYNFLDPNPIHPIELYLDGHNNEKINEIERVMNYYAELPYLSMNGLSKFLLPLMRYYDSYK